METIHELASTPRQEPANTPAWFSSIVAGCICNFARYDAADNAKRIITNDLDSNRPNANRPNARCFGTKRFSKWINNGLSAGDRRFGEYRNLADHQLFGIDNAVNELFNIGGTHQRLFG